MLNLFGQLLEIWQPLPLEQFQPVLLGEASQVGDERGHQQDIAREHLALLAELLDRVAPSEMHQPTTVVFKGSSHFMHKIQLK